MAKLPLSAALKKPVAISETMDSKPDVKAASKEGGKKNVPTEKRRAVPAIPIEFQTSKKVR